MSVDKRRGGGKTEEDFIVFIDTGGRMKSFWEGGRERSLLTIK